MDEKIKRIYVSEMQETFFLDGQAHVARLVRQNDSYAQLYIDGTEQQTVRQNYFDTHSLRYDIAVAENKKVKDIKWEDWQNIITTVEIIMSDGNIFSMKIKLNKDDWDNPVEACLSHEGIEVVDNFSFKFYHVIFSELYSQWVNKKESSTTN